MSMGERSPHMVLATIILRLIGGGPRLGLKKYGVAMNQVVSSQFRYIGRTSVGFVTWIF